MICLKGLIIVLRTPEEIKKCQFYTKHYAPMVLDSRGQQADYCFTLEQDLPDFWTLELESSGCSKWSNMVITAKPHRRTGDTLFLNDLIASKHTSTLHIGQHSGQTDATVQGSAGDTGEDTGHMHFRPSVSVSLASDSSNAPPAEDWRVSIFPYEVCTMLCNGHLAACILTGVMSSQTFRRHLFKNLRQKFVDNRTDLLKMYECNMMISVTYLLDVVAVWPEQRIDYIWGWCMNHLLTKRMLLEEAMAWLSTLGGAHSSLGEYFTHHAELAGQISMKQLRIAVMMGDPLTVGRCHMFWAYSLLQRGYHHKAKVIVKRVYTLATTHSVWDNRLVNMCKSAWSRLQHLHRAKRQKNRLHSRESSKVLELSVPEQQHKSADEATVSRNRMTSLAKHSTIRQQVQSPHNSSTIHI